MQKQFKIKAFYVFVFLFFVSSCGRKQKIFFPLSQEEVVAVNKLDLPSVKGLLVQQTDLGVYISWLPLFSEKTPSNIKEFEKNLLGFNIFRLEKNAMFIPKNPINKEIIYINHYVDFNKKINNLDSYTVQPIFKFGNKIVGGPSSQIIKQLAKKIPPT
ncbi:MAG: hypothetical protein US49_C0006G0074 [candidate division TM6 bacterium GW2011_GWF2_37_49]|nr:MAG: hypothetical protein US49_C0006G0074 [candidate division TM6 bacterium GW2011_GWF2_37_49]